MISTSSIRISCMVAASASNGRSAASTRPSTWADATPTDTGRSVWLLRHAKTVADPPPGGTDFDRVLAPRGRRDATALGQLFAGTGEGLPTELKRVPRPQVALVSPAARTTATAELVLEAVTDPPELRFEDGLYQADPNDVLAYLRELPDEVTAAMVVGHNPTAHALSQGLIRSGDKKGHRWRCAPAFPPAPWVSIRSRSRPGPRWRRTPPSWSHS